MTHRKSLAAAALATAALATGALAQGKPEGYTCCNFHYDKDWISDANWRQLPMVPAGAKIKVLDYSSNCAGVDIEGKPIRIGHDYSSSAYRLDKFIAKPTGKTDLAGQDM